MPTTVEVEVVGRWNALALFERLAPYHSYLVQQSRERWLVHASAPGYHEERLPEALETIERCLADRGVDALSIQVGERGSGEAAPSNPHRRG